MTRMLTGVGGVLSCAHEPVNADIFGGELHGHSYEVTAWFHNDEGADARVFQASLNTLLKLWDHKVLPPEMATAEGIARAVGTLGKCMEVEVRRPLERLHARWIADAQTPGDTPHDHR
jgi:hypothetical protein